MIGIPWLQLRKKQEKVTGGLHSHFQVLFLNEGSMMYSILDSISESYNVLIVSFLLDEFFFSWI